MAFHYIIITVTHLLNILNMFLGTGEPYDCDAVWTAKSQVDFISL